MRVAGGGLEPRCHRQILPVQSELGPGTCSGTPPHPCRKGMQSISEERGRRDVRQAQWPGSAFAGIGEVAAADDSVAGTRPALSRLIAGRPGGGSSCPAWRPPPGPRPAPPRVGRRNAPACGPRFKPSRDGRADPGRGIPRRAACGYDGQAAPRLAHIPTGATAAAGRSIQGDSGGLIDNRNTP